MSSGLFVRNSTFLFDACMNYSFYVSLFHQPDRLFSFSQPTMHDVRKFFLNKKFSRFVTHPLTLTLSLLASLTIILLLP